MEDPVQKPGPCHGESSQICSAAPFQQNPNFLEDLMDGFTMATKRESHDDLIPSMNVENTRNESVVAGPRHESAHPIPSASSSTWSPFVLLERIDPTLVDVFNSGTNSTLSQNLPSLVTQIKVENTDDENPSAGSCHKSARHIPSASSSLWNPSVLLERIDLNLMDAFNSGTKSTMSHLPSLEIQIKVENTEDEIPLAGPSMDGRSHLSALKKPSAFKKGSRFSTEGVGVKPKDRTSKGNLAQKRGGSKFDFAKGSDSIVLKAHAASFLKVITIKLTDCSKTVMRGIATDLDNDSNYVTGCHRGRLVPKSAFRSSGERPGPSKTKSDVLATGGLTQVSEKKLSLLNNSSKLVSKKKLRRGNKQISCSICTKQVLLSSLKAHLRTHSDKRDFSCKRCLKCYKSKGDLKKHLVTHSEKRPFSCKQCPVRFKSKGELNQHLTSHSDERPYSCKQCPARFKTKCNLNRHSVVHADQKPFICDQCLGRFKSKAELKLHLPAHSTERLFTCSRCQLCFKWKQSLKQHLQTHSDERPFSCLQCLKRFKSRATLAHHSRTHSDERPFSCEQCQARFRRKNEIRGHLLSHSDWKPWSCELCPARFKTKSHVKRHLIVHSDDKTFSCKQCPSRFKSKGELNNHLRRHCNEKPFGCIQCSARFVIKAELTVHLQRHSDEKPYSCEQCTACFKTKRDLTIHLQRHSDERPYSCKQCSARFKTTGDLFGHTSSHLDERLYSCEQCAACFKTKKKLNLHLTIHSDEKRFSCGHCSAQFHYKSYLRNHLRIHSDERPFSCEQCSASFKSKAYLQKHLLTHAR